MSPPPPLRLPVPLRLPAALQDLASLALDLRWVYTYRADRLWGQIDPDVWAITRNPWLILQTASPRRIAELTEDEAFLGALAAESAAHRRQLETPGWFADAHPASPLSCVAYFSLEFGLSDALPIYSGGLGILAGDHLKAAGDLDVPLVGVGLLYQQGYFRQAIDPDGAQIEFFPYNDPSQLPVTPMRDAEGAWLRLPVRVPGRVITVRAWEARVGRVRLYLLDTNDPLNSPPDRGITSTLYGGGPELRLQQEMLLGMGGWLLLRSLGLSPEVCHLNEGHAAFAVLARARSFMESSGQPFDVALTATRAGNVFTTHTPVDAGFDRFEPALVSRYLAPIADWVGVPLERLLALGRLRGDDPAEPFNMALLAIRGSGAVNGVSRLHGEVSRRLFQPLFPRWPAAEVPVGSVTNGVHVPTWESAEIGERLAEVCGEECWIGTARRIDEDLRLVTDAQLWQFRARQRHAMLDFVRGRLARQRGAAGEPPEAIEEARRLFDPDVLTIGFARRFAPYKRVTLLLQDPERLVRLLNDPNRPVQLVVAGKAHPRDEEGRALIGEWARFMRRPDVRGRGVFLDDYDMWMGERLVEGIDLWLNTPRRPWEASGTSGMKLLVNGGLNVSELDGWWAEAYSPEVGWAIGDGREHDADPAFDAAEANMLYEILERDVVPTFYERDAQGVPHRWVSRMRTSMVTLTPRFSADRMVREYTEAAYVPAAAAYRRRAADGGKLAAELDRWRRAIEAGFGDVHVAGVRFAGSNGEHLVEADVSLGRLSPDAVRVELFADGLAFEPARRIEMRRGEPLPGTSHGFRYGAAAPADRPAAHYTVRVVPRHPEARVPLEAPQILWQR